MERLIWAAAAPRQEVTHTVNDGTTFVAPDRVAVCFDDERAVADAGIVLPAALADRLGIEEFVDEALDLGPRPVAGERGRQGDDAGVRDRAGADPFDVGRVRTLDAQGELLPSWELYPFITNRTDALEVVEAEHRQHAVVELCIREQRPSAGAPPLRALLRQRRLDGHRRPVTQPAAVHGVLGLPGAPSASRAPYAAACSPSPAA